MVLSLAQVNAGVPQIGPRARYNIVTDRSSTWVIHKMAAGTLDGTFTQTAGQADPTLLDPTLVDGVVLWDNLTHGGLFTMLAAVGRTLVLEAVSGVGPFTTVDRSGNTLRSAFTAADLPLKLAPYETIRAAGGASAGVLVRIDDTTIL